MSYEPGASPGLASCIEGIAGFCRVHGARLPACAALVLALVTLLAPVQGAAVDDCQHVCDTVKRACGSGLKQTRQACLRACRVRPSEQGAEQPCRGDCRKDFARQRQTCVDQVERCLAMCADAGSTGSCETACGASRTACFRSLRDAGETKYCRSVCEQSRGVARNTCDSDIGCLQTATEEFARCLDGCAARASQSAETCQQRFLTCAGACPQQPASTE